MVPPADDEAAIIALHRYWMWCNRLREHFDATILDGRYDASIKRGIEAGGGRVAIASFFCDDPGIFISYWYGSLSVVVEGWQELGLTDNGVDTLLNSPRTATLKRYRNGTFHFQKHYWDDRFDAFIADKGSAEWARSLTTEYGRWFKERPRPQTVA